VRRLGRTFSVAAVRGCHIESVPCTVVADIGQMTDRFDVIGIRALAGTPVLGTGTD
jgi:hypothetical protein